MKVAYGKSSHQSIFFNLEDILKDLPEIKMFSKPTDTISKRNKISTLEDALSECQNCLNTEN